MLTIVLIIYGVCSILAMLIVYNACGMHSRTNRAKRQQDIVQAAKSNQGKVVSVTSEALSQKH